MATKRERFADRIVKDPAVMVGKPVVKGTRVPVERIIRHLADTPDFTDVLAAFPHLTMDDVKACLSYAAEALEREQRAELRPNSTPESASA